jgi:hypothetical protein
MKPIQIGRLLRASTSGCVVGCKVAELNTPALGGMVAIPLEDETLIYGLIYDIHIDDDGLVRQLVTAENVSAETLQDNRLNRNVPVEISVLFIGYESGEQIFHRLPPRPPLSLETMYPCTAVQICRFTSWGRFGYFRHILRTETAPVDDLLAAHIAEAGKAQRDAGNPTWINAAARELITLLRDDYATLNTVLNALSEVVTQSGMRDEG